MYYLIECRASWQMKIKQSHRNADTTQCWGAHLVGSSQLLELGLRIWISRILVWVHLLDLVHSGTDYKWALAG